MFVIGVGSVKMVTVDVIRIDSGFESVGTGGGLGLQNHQHCSCVLCQT